MAALTHHKVTSWPPVVIKESAIYYHKRPDDKVDIYITDADGVASLIHSKEDDSGWENCVYSSQYQQYAGFPHLSTRRINNIVYARGLAKSTTLTVPSNHLLGTIPNPDHRPSGRVIGASLGEYTLFYRVDITTSGDIMWLNPSKTFNSVNEAWFGLDQWFWFTD